MSRDGMSSKPFERTYPVVHHDECQRLISIAEHYGQEQEVEVARLYKALQTIYNDVVSRFREGETAYQYAIIAREAMHPGQGATNDTD